LCDTLEGTEPEAVDAECKGLLEAARRLNEVNRQLRNLIAANISARLEALTGGVPRYRGPATGPAAAYAPAYAYAGNRGEPGSVLTWRPDLARTVLKPSRKIFRSGSKREPTGPDRREWRALAVDRTA